MAWPGGQNFSGWDKFFSTIVEKFYPTIKIFGGTIFFLTGSTENQICTERTPCLNITIQLAILAPRLALKLSVRDNVILAYLSYRKLIFKRLIR